MVEKMGEFVFLKRWKKLRTKWSRHLLLLCPDHHHHLPEYLDHRQHHQLHHPDHHRHHHWQDYPYQDHPHQRDHLDYHPSIDVIALVFPPGYETTPGVFTPSACLVFNSLNQLSITFSDTLAALDFTTVNNNWVVVSNWSSFEACELVSFLQNIIQSSIIRTRLILSRTSKQLLQQGQSSPCCPLVGFPQIQIHIQIQLQMQMQIQIQI